MKTSEVTALARLANAAVAIEPNPISDTQRERQKALLEKQLREVSILKECCNVKYTFATKKLKGGSCLLFVKEKYSYEKYRVVCKNGYPVRFKTKTSAHIAAEAIHENGIADSGYELGETYNE